MTKKNRLEKIIGDISKNLRKSGYVQSSESTNLQETIFKKEVSDLNFSVGIICYYIDSPENGHYHIYLNFNYELPKAFSEEEAYSTFPELIEIRKPGVKYPDKHESLDDLAKFSEGRLYAPYYLKIKKDQWTDPQIRETIIEIIGYIDEYVHSKAYLAPLLRGFHPFRPVR